MADIVELDGTDVWLYTSPKAIYTDATLPSPYLHIAKPVGAGDDTTSATRIDRRNRDRAGVGALFILVSPSRHSVTPSLKLNGIYDADTAALLGAVAFVWASRAFVSTSRTLAAINSVA